MLFSGLLESICTMLGKIIDCKKTAIENQATTEIIEEKKDYKKATNIAEKIIAIAIKYKSEMTKDDSKNLNKYIEQFNKVN